MKAAATAWWRALMIAGGLAFGLIGDRRPFGEGFITHPLVVFAGVVAAALLILRTVLAKPVPEVIPERTMVIGFLLGLAGFLIGNWLSVHVMAAR